MSATARDGEPLGGEGLDVTATDSSTRDASLRLCSSRRSWAFAGDGDTTNGRRRQGGVGFDGTGLTLLCAEGAAQAEEAKTSEVGPAQPTALGGGGDADTAQCDSIAVSTGSAVALMLTAVTHAQHAQGEHM